jgi:hypothetical protein
VSVRVEPRFTRDIDLAVAVTDDALAESLVADLVAMKLLSLAPDRPEDGVDLHALVSQLSSEDGGGPSMPSHSSRPGARIGARHSAPHSSAGWEAHEERSVCTRGEPASLPGTYTVMYIYITVWLNDTRSPRRDRSFPPSWIRPSQASRWN